jgi:hypothetical protein
MLAVTARRLAGVDQAVREQRNGQGKGAEKRPHRRARAWRRVASMEDCR